MLGNKIIKKLPITFQTETQRKFFESTFDQLFSKKNSKHVNGFIGRREGGAYKPATDYFLEQPTDLRNNYQLEPIALSKDSNTLENVNSFFYLDLLDKLKFYGANIENHDRLFSGNYYNFAPPIDMDKYLNYQNYFWVPDAEVIEISDDIDIASNVIGQLAYTTPSGIEFTSGLRVKFTHVNIQAQWINVTLTVEQVGRGIILVPEKSTLLTVDQTQFLPWDELGSLWDSLAWDAVQAFLPADYITIERGSCDANAWSRTNRWYHKDVIDKIALETGTEIPASATQAKRPIIEFVKDLELYNAGSQFNTTVRVAADAKFTDIQGESIAIVDGVTLLDGDLLIFLNPSNVSLFEPWDIQGWDTLGWEASLSSEGVMRFIWQVQYVNGVIDLVPYPNSTTPVINGDIVQIEEGTNYTGASFYYNDVKWNQVANEKVKSNQPPLFNLYDTDGIKLDDESIYPGSTFKGSKIFSYKINDETTINDTVLGFPVEYKNLGQLSDVVFQHDLETNRYTYLLYDESTNINGYYYFKNQHSSPDCVFDPKFEHTWVPATEKIKQRIIDRYVITTDGNNVFKLSANPSNASIADILSDDVIVKIDGIRKHKITDWNIAINAITGSAEITTVNGLLLNQVLEIFTYTKENLPVDAGGYYEIPAALEANPNNLEVTEYTINEFTSHFNSIIENQIGLVGGTLGAKNNYRDTAKDLSTGTFILQNRDPLLKTMFALSDNTVNVIDAIRFASREYSRFKNSFVKKTKQLIDTGFTPFKYGDVIAQEQWFEEIITELNLTKQHTNSFTYSYMIASGDVFKLDTITPDGVSTEYTLTEFEDIAKEENTLYVYKDGQLLVIDNDYSIINLNPITVKFKSAPGILSDIVIKLYNNSAAARIPATPSKLGMYPVFVPRIETDTSYLTPVDVIVGHDGSRTPLYGDYRDDLLLELERRIYNGINPKFRQDYDLLLTIEDVAPGFFRDTNYSVNEFNKITKSLFSRWSVQMNADFRVNEFTDVTNPSTPFLNSSATWNWSGTGISDVDLPGNWKGIYLRYYDTLTPQHTPWEMLGFKIKPSWWEPTYGLGPYRNAPSDIAMWTDIEQGLIREGLRAGIDVKYARPGFLASYLPVDSLGNLLSPIDIGIATTPSTSQKTKSWKYGDVAPVENAWRLSESYPFAVLEILCMMKPAAFGERFWNPVNSQRSVAQPEQVISQESKTRQSNSELTVHGETVNNIVQINSGYQQYISDQILFLGKSVKTEFGDKIRHLDVKLGHKYASFTNENTMRTFAESFSTVSQSTSLLLPASNVQVDVYTSPSIEEYVYSGVLVKVSANGKYQVYGYDVNNLDFKILPRSPSSRIRQVTVAATPEEFTYFTLGNTYEKHTLVKYNSIYYRSLETHVATTFNSAKWKKLSELPQTGGISISHKLDGLDNVELVDYGTIFNNEEEVFNFLISYGDYLESVGWKFETVDTSRNVLQDWKEMGKQFLFWAASGWQVDNFITLSPSSDKVVFDAPKGYPMNIERTVNGVYSILDKHGVVIDPRNTLVSRRDTLIEVSHKDANAGIYGLRVNVAETEHIIVFDNNTIFDDVIYNPLLLSRQTRLEISAVKTDNWTGKLEAAGYLVTTSGLIPNFENITNSIRDYHNVREINDNPVIEDTARHLIGYENRPYLESLKISDDTQYQFYQGMLLEKGTNGAIQRLLRSDFVSDKQEIKTYEEWAIKLSEFGHVCVNQRIDLRLNAAEVKGSPQLVELDYPSSLTGSVTQVVITNAVNIYTSVPEIVIVPVPGNDNVVSAQVTATLDSEGRIASLTIIDGGSGYTHDPAVFINDGFSSVNWDILGWDLYPYSAAENNPDEIIAIVTKVITEDSPYDDVLVIDIDDNERWLSKPHNCEQDILWPTTSKIDYNIPNAGYVNPADVSHKTFSISTLPELWNTSTIIQPIESDTVWIAKSTNEDWNVYRLDALGVAWNIPDIDDENTYPSEVIIDVDGNINLVLLNEIPYSDTTTRYVGGKIIVQNTLTNSSELYSYELVNDNSGLGPYTYSIYDDANEPITTETLITSANVLHFVSLRYSDTAARIASGMVFSAEEYVWIDSINDKWTVQRYTGTDFVLHRQQEPLIDSLNFKNAYLYDKTTTDTLSRMPIYDPFKGLIPGIADQNIEYKTHTDPARYTNAASADLINEDRLFDSDNEGMVWWDQSTYRCMYYEQGTNKERRDNWGNLFPGSVISIYEWTRSYKLPANYDGTGTVRNTTDYVKKVEYILELGEDRNVYYYWVSNKTQIPNLQKRTLNVIEVARTIADPTSQAFQWVSPVSENAFIFANINHLLSDKDSVIQLNYRTIEEDIDAHAEWKLVRENDPGSTILNQHWDKMVDSLVGTDKAGLLVPDPHLSEFEKYGVSVRPRQSWFTNIHQARKIFVQKANALLISICLYDLNSNWANDIDTNEYWDYVDWYSDGFTSANTTPAQQVETIGELNQLTVNDGDIVKVIGTDRYSLYKYDDAIGIFTLIKRERCAIQIKESLYTSTKLLSLQTELRQILNAFRKVVFINDYIVNTNLIFFALVNFVLSEQDDVDWIFKTSYLYLTQSGDELTQDRNFKKDSFNSTLDYINEIKPYRSKVRDYAVNKRLATDLATGTGNDDVRTINTKLVYDRVTCELSIFEIRVARNIKNFSGYVTLGNSEPYNMRLGAAGRFVQQQLDLLDDILFVPTPGNNLTFDVTDFSEEFHPSSINERLAAEVINERLHEALSCGFQGPFNNGISFAENPTIEWDTTPWDSALFDVDLVAIDVEGTSPSGQFIQLGESELFIGSSGQDNVPLMTQTSFGPLTVNSGNIAVFVNGQQVTNFYVYSNNLVLLDDVLPTDEIAVFEQQIINAAGFIQPDVLEQVTDELAPVSSVENIVFLVDVNRRTRKDCYDGIPVLQPCYIISDSNIDNSTLIVTVNDVVMTLGVDYIITGTEWDNAPYDSESFDATCVEFINLIAGSVHLPTYEICLTYQVLPLLDGGIWDIEPWDNEGFDTPVIPDELSFKMHIDVTGHTKYLRNSNDHSAKLAVDLLANDAQIEIMNEGVIGIESNPTQAEPGIIWIGAERIEFYMRTGTILSDLRRGTQGTSVLPLIAANTKIFDGSDTQDIPFPEDFNWVNSNGGLSFSNTIQAEFLKQYEGTYEDL